MVLLELLLTAAFSGIVHAQDATTPNVIVGSGNNAGSVLCNKTFADANATGIFSVNPGVAQGRQEGQPDNNGNAALPAQWAMTLWDNIGASNATAEVTGWYNTNGANYSDNAGLYYDACVIQLAGLSMNTYYRSANDQGDCMETFDAECVEALQTQAVDLALGLYENATPNPGSNLSSGSLGRVCYEIGNTMQDNFPKQCVKYFDTKDIGITVGGSPLTSSNDSFVYEGCELTNEEDNSTFHSVLVNSVFTSTYSVERQQAIYDAFSYIVWPVITLFMPIADVAAQNTIANANAPLTCARINRFNEGSREAVAPPEPTPVGGGGLSGGAIAGIVVGVVVAIAIVLGALWFFWFRKRRASKKAQKADDGAPPPAYTADPKMAEAPQDHAQTPLTELAGQDAQMRPELPTQKSGPRVELAGNAAESKQGGAVGAPPAELPADLK